MTGTGVSRGTRGGYMTVRGAAGGISGMGAAGNSNLTRGDGAAAVGAGSFRRAVGGRGMGGGPASFRGATSRINLGTAGVGRGLRGGNLGAGCSREVGAGAMLGHSGRMGAAQVTRRGQTRGGFTGTVGGVGRGLQIGVHGTRAYHSGGTGVNNGVQHGGWDHARGMPPFRGLEDAVKAFRGARAGTSGRGKGAGSAVGAWGAPLTEKSTGMRSVTGTEDAKGAGVTTEATNASIAGGTTEAVNAKKPGGFKHISKQRRLEFLNKNSKYSRLFATLS